MDKNTLTIGSALPDKQQLIFDACLKMQQGRELYEQGYTEFMNLTGGKMKEPKNDGSVLGIRRISKKGSSAAKKAALTRNGDKSTFRKSKMTDDQLGEKIVAVIHTEGSATVHTLRNRLNFGERRIMRVVSELLHADKVAWGTEGGPGKPKYLIIPTKKINGNHVLSLKKKEKHGRRGAYIDVTSPELVARATKFLQTHDWVNKNKFIEAVDVSPGPGNRLLDYLQKQKIVRKVMKNHNPEHKDVQKMYVRDLAYYELV